MAWSDQVMKASVIFLRRTKRNYPFFENDVMLPSLPAESK
jgi:hypothetical protein